MDNIVPFRIAISKDRILEIKHGLERYNWDQLSVLKGWSSGISVADLKRLVDYWINDYDWYKTEEELNRLPHYQTTVEGECIHFIHFKGDGSKVPILLLHGWPGSFLEFEHIWEELRQDGHDVIMPSLPGFAFSNPITAVIGPRRAAELMHVLMKRLFSDTQYMVQGGDWGAHIASWMAYLQPAAVKGFHINMASVYAEDVVAESNEEKAWFNAHEVILDWETGYNHQQETRPQTLLVAMVDSPVGAAAWIMEKFGKWADLRKRADGSPDLWSKFQEETLITNIMLYLAPSAFATSLWIYHGKRLEKSDKFPAGTHIDVPTAIAAFPDPVFTPAPRTFLEKTYNVVQYNRFPAGGHFAAMEEPVTFLADLQTFITFVNQRT